MLIFLFHFSEDVLKTSVDFNKINITVSCYSYNVYYGQYFHLPASQQKILLLFRNNNLSDVTYLFIGKM